VRGWLAQKVLLTAGRLAKWLDPDNVTIKVTRPEEEKS
jgi:hypothetical protein